MSGKMTRQNEVKVLKIKGMTCVNCEHHIEEALNKQEGIIHAKASYQEESVTVAYEGAKITLEDIINRIEKSGYSAEMYTGQETDIYRKVNQILLGILIVMAGGLVLRRTGLLSMLRYFPEANENTSYIMLTVTGFLTSFHCIAMCGGIQLSQCMKEEQDSLRPPVLYNLGRVLSYTAMGAVVGAIGSVVSLPGRMQGAVQLLAGAFMIIMGFNMLGAAKWLRRFNLRMPKQFAQIVYEKKESSSPFLVGILNGFMPCGPLQSMQLYALSTGSMVNGALSMFLFSIGTVPIMFLLGAFSSILSRRSAGKMVKFGAVIVVVLGLSMFQNGLNLAGVGISYGKNNTPVKAEMKHGVQEVRIDLESGSYTPIIVEKGTRVRWIVNAKDGTLNGCNNKMIVREYGIAKKLSHGETVIEFTPEETGTIPYSCWMGMIRSSIYVVEPGI